jgi:hypothetical protein
MSILAILTMVLNKLLKGFTNNTILFHWNLLLKLSRNGGSGRTRTCDLVLLMQQKINC